MSSGDLLERCMYLTEEGAIRNDEKLVKGIEMQWEIVHLVAGWGKSCVCIKGNLSPN